MIILSQTFLYLLLGGLYGTHLLLELFAALSPGHGYILKIINYRLFSRTGHWALGTTDLLGPIQRGGPQTFY